MSNCFFCDILRSLIDINIKMQSTVEVSGVMQRLTKKHRYTVRGRLYGHENINPNAPDLQHGPCYNLGNLGERIRN